MNLLSTIREHSKSDEQLLKLLNRASEYAGIYILAKLRQKGCDGMGEVATLNDEFKSIVDELINYCRSKEYLQEDVSYDISLITGEFKDLG